MSDTQILLSHVLSGGLPRDFLRCARAIGELEATTNARKLDALLGGLLDDEIRTRINGVRAAVMGRPQNWNIGPFMNELEMLERSGLGPETPQHLREFLAGDPEFAHLCGQRETLGASASSGAAAARGTWHAETRRQLYGYLYFADTVRLAFTSWQRFSNADETLSVFEPLATAKQRLESDATAGWRAASHSRQSMSLPTIDLEVRIPDPAITSS